MNAFSTSNPPLHGVMAKFNSPADLVEAANQARLAGYKVMDGYSPFPVEHLNEAMGRKNTRLPLLVLLGGIAGALTGYGLQYYTMVIAYPMNIGGRPLHSWPSFIPVSYELTILFASFTAALGMLAINGFPQPYHPVFNVEAFAAASDDKFFLCIESTDPKFDAVRTTEFLKGLKPEGVYEVPA